MNIRSLTTAILLLLTTAAGAAVDKNDALYLVLRDSMSRAFNDGDSARFANHIKRLEDYLLEQNDLHGYYTQRCNEIVFLMNRRKIYEAYKLGRQLSEELREKKLDREMYMAFNIMGHIYRFCGNEESAKKCFRQVIQLMEDANYRESMPPIYMNIVNVEMENNPEEAMRLLDEARKIAIEASPERVFDIETRRSLGYYNMGRKDDFLKGYKAYKEGVAQGKTSVHGRQMEIYYQACMGNIDKAVELAYGAMDDDAYGTVASLYKDAGRWKEAYQALDRATKLNDSINSLILSNSMQGMQDELRIYEMEREANRQKQQAMYVTIALLAALVVALGYILFSRRRHLRQLNEAYQHALESDKTKMAFIQNMSHEVRTPLNIIAGFAQVIADPEAAPDADERKDIARMVLRNTRTITNQIDEMLELSINESAAVIEKNEGVNIGALLETLITENREFAHDGVEVKLINQLPTDFAMTTNPSMVKRIVYLLLDNALKNTEQGHINIKAMADESALTIAVEDTGCGIPAEEQAHIFERFSKLDTFKEGLGLGLPLCRIIASRLRGSVVLDTHYAGPGARFIVTLPI